jgi:DoxX-like family
MEPDSAVQRLRNSAIYLFQLIDMEEQFMQSAAQTASVPKKRLWAGRTINALMVLFLLFDSGLKVMKLAPAVEATARLGYPARLVLAIGIAELICVVLLVIPRTSILGAILLTGYLGGATATQVRLEDPWFFFPVVISLLVWGGLYLRDERLRALLPLRSFPTGTVAE